MPLSRAAAAASILVWSLLVSTVSAQTLIWPGEAIKTIDAVHLRAYVPAAAAERLKPLVARADQIYAHMIADAGFVPRDKLRLLVADWLDAHNGYSFVVPFSLVQIELAPAEPESPIFAGGLDSERTLVHEFAHQISNDRNSGVRGLLESIFGRVLPNDLLSLLVWYASTPAHQTMPRFWQEGLAVWAETSYADPAGAWAGRGRDSLTHMVWRLAAAAGAIPDESEWRITQQEWPFGGVAYYYGTAYTRFLEGRLGDRASVWRMARQQAEQWAFLFDRGARATTGRRHGDLLAEARHSLLQEQLRIMATLQGAGLLQVARLTPEGMSLGAPAWSADGSLQFAGKPAHGRSRLHRLAPDGALSHTGDTMVARSAVRALPDGGITYHEYNWRGISHVVVAGSGGAWLGGWRMMQPDASALHDGVRTIVAVQLRDGGGQDLVVHRLSGDLLDEGRVVATQGTPWTPALRPGDGRESELCWVETDAGGSRLVLGSLLQPMQRNVLFAVRGRILQPTWSADGASVFCCADHTGVCNAYCIDVAGDRASVLPVTNTLGGVIACVPSPDGAQLAIVDHDHHGPFLARMSADRAQWAKSVPVVPLAWPAPVESVASAAAVSALRPTPIATLPTGAADALQVSDYSGLGELRPRFWAPSTFAVPEGGYGVYGLMTDPLLTHVVQAGIGVGLVEQEPVGSLRWDYLGSALEFGIEGGRSERTFGRTILDTAGNDFDYTETVANGEVRLGRGLFALERTFLCYGAFGIEDHDEVDDAARRYAGRALAVGQKAAFRDTEEYAEFTVGYDDSTFYPSSYSAEDGFRVLGVYRHSGFGGELTRNLAFADTGYTWSLFPEAGHQVVLRGQLGWSDGDDTLQGNFSVGGGLAHGLPRGYFDATVSTGRHLVGGSFAYRFPVFRPFVAASTTPFRGRQLVVELFGDTAKVSDDHSNGHGDWFTSVGGELHANAEFFDGILSPGLGVAVQLDGERDVRGYFTLGFSF